jgi:hypothetical protein
VGPDQRLARPDDRSSVLGEPAPRAPRASMESSFRNIFFAGDLKPPLKQIEFRSGDDRHKTGSAIPYNGECRWIATRYVLAVGAAIERGTRRTGRYGPVMSPQGSTQIRVRPPSTARICPVT